MFKKKKKTTSCQEIRLRENGQIWEIFDQSSALIKVNTLQSNHYFNSIKKFHFEVFNYRKFFLRCHDDAPRVEEKEEEKEVEEVKYHPQQFQPFSIFNHHTS